jgi:hypothetical protein
MEFAKSIFGNSPEMETFIAGGALVAGTAVKFSAGKVVACANNEVPFGVATGTAALNDEISVILNAEGICWRGPHGGTLTVGAKAHYVAATRGFGNPGTGSAVGTIIKVLDADNDIVLVKADSVP